MQPAQDALDRWLRALHGFGDLALVQAAVAAQGQVDRFGWDASRGLVVERFQGPAQVAAWCARTPRNVTFAVVDGPRPEDGAPGDWQARYEVRIGDYRNQGTWRFRLDAEGRILHLEHQPDDLPLDWRDGLPAGKSLGPPGPPRPHAADAGHAHAHGHHAEGAHGEGDGD
ncbi:hypothetical protein L6R53_32405 [Myxococcota bacterium]|nr:hypothetical protein [Myxococcota bacterium]